jgi:tRNA dimethylallyltransferase
MSLTDSEGKRFDINFEQIQPLVTIVGPTAVGKTEISIQLAERLDGEIISADSRLFYRGMNIGTAKPTATEMSRVAHHMVDIAEPDEVLSLAVFQQTAIQAIEEVQRRGKLPLLVGGTGQFVRAVTEGWRIPKVGPDQKLRAVLADWAAEISPLGLHQRLNKLDPLAAERINPQNLRRTIRAMEVIFNSGYKFSDQQGHNPIFDHVLVLGLTRRRDELYSRIDERIYWMFDRGFIDEVQKLLDQGFSPGLPAFSAIGYGEVIAYLRGRVTYEEAITLIKRQTRVFVRRQTNWFKLSDPDIHWFTPGPECIADMEDFIHSWLSGLASPSLDVV